MEHAEVATNCQRICASLADPGSDRGAPELTGITISCFVNEVPLFAETEMENLYGNLYSSLRKFRVFGGMEGASTYVVRKDGKIVVIFLFRMDKGRVRVMNEVIKIDEEEIRRFSEMIFFKFKSASVISFNTIQTDALRLPFPFQQFNASENIVITLPGSQQEYFASLGNATRQNIT